PREQISIGLIFQITGLSENGVHATSSIVIDFNCPEQQPVKPARRDGQLKFSLSRRTFSSIMPLIGLWPVSFNLS
ncbi:MAG: hypothetical protein ACLQHM_08975, partial [Limisphaerales bacterium]